METREMLFTAGNVDRKTAETHSFATTNHSFAKLSDFSPIWTGQIQSQLHTNSPAWYNESCITNGG